MKIDIADFNYDLPEERIAKSPVSPRDKSKLLYSKNGKISHHSFKDLVELLPKNTKLVFNNTKVIPARLLFKRATGAIIEVFLLQPIFPSAVLSEIMNCESTAVWKCIVGNKKKWKFDETLHAEVKLQNTTFTLSAQWENYQNNEVRLNWTIGQLSEMLNAFGNIPLPPYLNREAVAEDLINYQTVYSKNEGAVAAPTAGLHFTENIVSKLAKKGIESMFLTLHVGAGTFMPVKVENALDHPMHCEQIVFTKTFIDKLFSHINEPIIPVGTTSLRSLESLYWFGQKLKLDKNAVFFIEKLYPYQFTESINLQESIGYVLKYIEFHNLDEIIGNSEIMIFPGYDFKICQGIITNFHQPKSTLLLLIAALIGEKHWKDIYQAAMDNDYRFLSFGDSSLLLK